MLDTSVGRNRASVRSPDGAIPPLPIIRVLGANLAGAVATYLYLALVTAPASSTEESYALEIASVATYVLLAGAFGLWLANRTLAPVTRWIEQERPPSDDELKATLEQPLRQSRWVFALWVGAAVGFAGLHMIPNNPIHYDPGYGVMIGAVVLLGGLAAATLSYLLVEQGLRPAFALALSYRAPTRPQTLGVAGRIIVAWALGSGVILVAIALAPAGSPHLSWAIWFLVPVGLVAGGVIITTAAQSVAQPVAAMRAALERIEQGDYEARVPVDDGSEVGLLQAGFNQMAAGLAERERLRQVFGTYVDAEVAQHILNEGTSLAGEEVEVTLMFVDIRDFTGFAERASPQDVVATINRMFERVVPIVHDHGGHVDKFIGDGLLAVFGAPRRQSDHADQALAAAVEIQRAVDAEFESDLGVGIGLNSGRVVAGNVGGAGRFEFSVIGDAVNVAARVEAATRITNDTILVSEHTKELLRKHAIELEPRADIPLKGKSRHVALYAPRDRGSAD